jgi:hypothetical protein
MPYVVDAFSTANRNSSPQRQKLIGGYWITLLNLRQDSGDVGHGYEDSQPSRSKPESAHDQA